MFAIGRAKAGQLFGMNYEKVHRADKRVKIQT